MEASRTADCKHTARHGVWHMWWGVHCLNVCGQTYGELDHRGIQHRVAKEHPTGLPGSGKHALWSGLVEVFEPFATAIYERTVPADMWELPSKCVDRKTTIAMPMPQSRPPPPFQP